MKKIEILVVVRWPIGGIRAFLSYLYRTFDVSRYRLTILLPKYSEHDTLLKDLEPLNPSYVILQDKCGYLHFARACVRILKSQGIDIVHSHGLTAGIYSSFFTRIAGIPHIMSMHELIYPEGVNSLRNGMRLKLLEYVLRNVDVVHVPGDAARDSLLRSFPKLRSTKRRPRIVSIPHGIDTTAFLEAQERDIRGELGLGQDTFVIGFLGRFMPVKGFEYLRDALEILVRDGNGITKQPIIVTFGWGGYIREEMERVRAKGLERWVVNLPFTANAAAAIKGLDVVAIPSLSEACPLVPMEALVAGIPVVGTDCRGLREILQDTPSRMVRVADSEALAQALKQEMMTPSREKAKAFAAEAALRFDRKPRFQQLETVIAALASHRSSAAAPESE